MLDGLKGKSRILRTYKRILRVSIYTSKKSRQLDSFNDISFGLGHFVVLVVGFS